VSRCERIIEFIHARGSVKSSDLASMFNVSRQAALKELTSMVEKNLIQREGDRRGARYVLR
jgi:DeoR/GlpR family transcriptional regulator of sugar metabolism